MSGSGARVLVAALLLFTAGPWMPVLCFASGHIEVEMPFAGCCAHNPGSASQTTGDPSLLSPSAASDCGDCTDTPLVSVWPPESVQTAVTLESPPAPLPVGFALPSEFSAILVPSAGLTEPSCVLGFPPQSPALLALSPEVQTPLLFPNSNRRRVCLCQHPARGYEPSFSWW